MKWIQYVVLVTIAITSCAQDKKKSITHGNVYSDLQSKYESAIDFFGAENTTHFPETPDFTRYNFTESFSPIMGNLELVLWSKESANITEDLQELTNSAIAYYSASDTCLIIVNRFINQEDLHNAKPTLEELKLINRDCYMQKVPILNFWHNDYTTDDNRCRLPADFEIYVLDARSGPQIKKELLTDGQYMPTEWKNGMSKGIALSEKRGVVIYWVTIW
jgi:hypothetical protein